MQYLQINTLKIGMQWYNNQDFLFLSNFMVWFSVVKLEMLVFQFQKQHQKHTLLSSISFY